MPHFGSEATWPRSIRPEVHPPLITGETTLITPKGHYNLEELEPNVGSSDVLSNSTAARLR